ncbi:MAG: alpha-glucosidase C-terminal domain-containing protein, partial [Schleiferiaceae bacterium]
SHADVVCFKRSAGAENLLVFANTRNQTVTMNLATEIKNSTWTDALTGATTSLGTTLTLAPYEYLLLK